MTQEIQQRPYVVGGDLRMSGCTESEVALAAPRHCKAKGHTQKWRAMSMFEVAFSALPESQERLVIACSKNFSRESNARSFGIRKN